MFKRYKKQIIIALSILILTFVYWLYWSNSSIEISHFNVLSNKLPNEFSEFSIAHISDLHNAEFGNDNEKLIKLLENEKPNIIAITGDLIDSNHTNTKIALSFVRQALEIAPCYYVTGNHEAWLGSEYDDIADKLTKIGVKILNDEKIDLEYNGAYIQLVGLNDPYFSEQDDVLSESILDSKLSALNLNDEYTILLSHRPEFLDLYSDFHVDLVLSGHAHGGQFRIPFIGGLVAPNQGFFPKYDEGMYQEKNTTMIVSRGIGNSIIPLRFNNCPELVMIKLKKK